MTAAEPAVDGNEGATVGAAGEHGLAVHGQTQGRAQRVVVGRGVSRSLPGRAVRALDEGAITRTELFEHVPKGPIAEKRCGFPVLDGSEQGARAVDARGQAFQEMAFGARQAVSEARQLGEQALDGVA